MINFNEAPYLGDELKYVKEAIDDKHICGDGKFTKKCNTLLEKYTTAKQVLLTNSCTAALEMAALLLDIHPGDEIICPSYTFVTTASSFALRGAKLVFVDIRDDTLNIDETLLEDAITSKTKAIVPVHYAGVCSEMDDIRKIASLHKLYVVEDAAQAVGSYYKNSSAGTLSDLGCYSFHETKNITSGEGGAILINNDKFIEQAEIIREKGTNRSKFLRGQVDKYTWVSLGSSYLPSDMLSAYLYPQLCQLEAINSRRKLLWNRYYNAFLPLQSHGIRVPFCPRHCKHNAHMFYLRCTSLEERSALISHLKNNGIQSVFHYIPLHSSPAGQVYGITSGDMKVTNRVSETLVRLPLYYGLSDLQQSKIIEHVLSFWE